MGDVVSLVERAQEQFDEEEARKLKKETGQKNQFNFNDFISQIQQIKKMGNLKDLASMLPRHGQDAQERGHSGRCVQADRGDHLVDDPRRARASRDHQRPPARTHRQRFGTTMADVNRLMKQFDDTRKMMKAVAGGGMKMPKMPGGMMRR